MFDILKVRKNQGKQYIPDIKKAVIHEKFRGLPNIKNDACLKDCNLCVDLCPTGAISKYPVKIDLGKCIFCGECQRVCPQKIFKFSNFHKTSSTSREFLIVDSSMNPDKYLSEAIKANDKIKAIFGRSLKIRQVSAAGCNGCELELNACGNVNFDMGRFGIEFVASPRHADVIVITGPVSENMAAALDDAYHSTPEPKLIIVAGACAISGGVFAQSKAINREFLKKYKPDLFIPGCPIHPLTFINAILGFLAM